MKAFNSWLILSLVVVTFQELYIIAFWTVKILWQNSINKLENAIDARSDIFYSLSTGRRWPVTRAEIRFACEIVFENGAD